MKRGQFLITPPATPGDDHVDTPNALAIMGLPHSYFAAAIDDLSLRDFSVEPLLKTIQSDPVVARLMRDAWSEAENGGEQGALFIDTTAFAMVARIIGLAARARIHQTSTAKLTASTLDIIRDFVENNVDGAIRMKALASIAGMNEYEFARQFRAKPGKPPYQWVIEQRLIKATQLLVRTELPLADIAYACGFSSQAHKTSLFRKKRGATPLQVRNENR